MPRILILGATGYLAASISRSLLQTGNHTVWGLTRSSAKSRALLAAEITPVVSPDPTKDPSTYLDAIKRHKIDIVIDATSAYGDSLEFLGRVSSASRERLAAADKLGYAGPKIGYIYISGLWVHGVSAQPTSDLDPVGTPSAESVSLDIVAWRPALERAVLSARDVLNVCIIRPAQMYGYASSAWSAALGPIANAVAKNEASIALPFNPDARVAVCHVDDVGDAICSAAENIEVLSSVYPIFDIVQGQEPLAFILQTFADTLSSTSAKTTQGAAGRTTKVSLTGDSDDAYMQALGATINASNARAQKYLGWRARRTGFAAGMEVYARAWEAGQAK